MRNAHTGGQQPSQETVVEVLLAGGVEVHRDRAVGQAEALDGGTRVAGADVLVVDGGVIGRELDVKGLGLDVLGRNGHGRGQDGGGDSGSLHVDGVVVVDTIRGVFVECL